MIAIAVKKSNVISVNLTHKNVMFLQNLGFLNKKKKSTQRLNISEFVNRCIDHFLAIEKPEQNKELEARLIISNINELQKRRDKLESQIRREAQVLAEVRAGPVSSEPPRSEIKAEKVIEVLETQTYESPIDTQLSPILTTMR